jgi:hypothetical protein
VKKRDFPDSIKKRRTVDSHKIMSVTVSGDAILEKPAEFPGKHFPWVQVYGEYIVIDGRVHWYGIGRFTKDAQRSYNVSRTAITETIALAPQAKFWATAVQAEGHVDKWAEAHKKNFPFQLYNPDPKAPGAPQDKRAAEVPVALIQETQIASNELKEVSGIFEGDIGQANAAKSGRQELARQAQGQVATYNYPDNMAKAIQRTWEIIVGMIPHVYDTERTLRILGGDDSDDYVKVNTFVTGDNGEKIKVNDMSSGRYDTTITVGPSFSTKRQEATEVYQPMLQSNPELMPIIGDLVFKSMDLPYADEIADRLKAIQPPQIQQMQNEGQQMPPEIQAMMQQAQQAMAMVEEQAQQVQQEAQEADIAKSEVEKLLAKLAMNQAKFEAKIAQGLAKVAEADARLTMENLQQESEGVIEQSTKEAQEIMMQFNAALAEDVATVLGSIQGIAGQLSQQAVGTMEEIKLERDKKPRAKTITSRRVDGNLVADIHYEDEEPEVTH